MYAIYATHLHTTSDGYTGSRQSPTFYLDPNVQGIRDERHAESIAREILLFGAQETQINDTLLVTAVRV